MQVQAGRRELIEQSHTCIYVEHTCLHAGIKPAHPHVEFVGVVGVRANWLVNTQIDTMIPRKWVWKHPLSRQINAPYCIVECNPFFFPLKKLISHCYWAKYEPKKSHSKVPFGGSWPCEDFHQPFRGLQLSGYRLQRWSTVLSSDHEHGASQVRVRPFPFLFFSLFFSPNFLWVVRIIIIIHCSRPTQLMRGNHGMWYVMSYLALH